MKAVEHTRCRFSLSEECASLSLNERASSQFQSGTAAEQAGPEFYRAEVSRLEATVASVEALIGDLRECATASARGRAEDAARAELAGAELRRELEDALRRACEAELVLTAERTQLSEAVQQARAAFEQVMSLEERQSELVADLEEVRREAAREFARAQAEAAAKADLEQAHDDRCGEIALRDARLAEIQLRLDEAVNLASAQEQRVRAEEALRKDLERAHEDDRATLARQIEALNTRVEVVAAAAEQRCQDLLAADAGRVALEGRLANANAAIAALQARRANEELRALDAAKGGRECVPTLEQQLRVEQGRQEAAQRAFEDERPVANEKSPLVAGGEHVATISPTNQTHLAREEVQELERLLAEATDHAAALQAQLLTEQVLRKDAEHALQLEGARHNLHARFVAGRSRDELSPVPVAGNDRLGASADGPCSTRKQRVIGARRLAVRASSLLDDRRAAGPGPSIRGAMGARSGATAVALAAAVIAALLAGLAAPGRLVEPSTSASDVNLEQGHVAANSKGAAARAVPSRLEKLDDKVSELSRGGPMTLSPPFVPVDGVTFSSGHETFRLGDVEGPSWNGVCRNGEGELWACGLRARAALYNLIRGAAVVCDATTGSIGEKLLEARCSADGRDVAAALTVGGWVRPVAGAPRYHAEAAQAREEKRGLWDGGWSIDPERSKAVVPGQ